VDNRCPTRGSQNDALEWVCRNRNDANYCGVAMLYGLYILLVSCVDSHPSLDNNGRQEGTNCSRAPSREGSSSPSSISTPSLSPSVSPLTLGSLPEVSSHHLHSLVFEQGGPSKRISVVDLSLDEEDLFPDSSWDEEFTRKLFGDLNHSLLRSRSDGNVIILSNSDEDEERVCEEDAVDVDASPPSVVSPQPQPSPPIRHMINADLHQIDSSFNSCSRWIMLYQPLIRCCMLTGAIRTLT
jgi:hypothetical protein